MAALVILALAEPVFNPQQRAETGSGPLAVVMDNGWASAPDWDRRVATAERLIADAGEAGVPVVLALHRRGSANAEIGPFDAEAALDRLRAAEPRPGAGRPPGGLCPRRGRALDAAARRGGVAVLADGLAAATATTAAPSPRLLGANVPAGVVWAAPDRLDMVGLTAAENEVDGFNV